jgi:hypothetical protein
MSDAPKLAVLAAAMVVAGLMALYGRGPAIPKPEWPPSPTWSSRRDRMFAGASVLLLGGGVIVGGLSILAMVLASTNAQS